MCTDCPGKAHRRSEASLGRNQIREISRPRPRGPWRGCQHMFQQGGRTYLNMTEHETNLVRWVEGMGVWRGKHGKSPKDLLLGCLNLVVSQDFY